jgi:hypothetical protein
MALKASTRPNNMSEADQFGSGGTVDERFAFGLSVTDVEEFREILRSECGEELSLSDAWSRAIEVLALCRMLLGPLPEDPAQRA